MLTTCQEATALTEMRVFDQLWRLEMVEINRMQYHLYSGQETLPFQYVFSPKTNFFDVLTMQHLTMRRVLLTGHQKSIRRPPGPFLTALWERYGKRE